MGQTPPLISRTSGSGRPNTSASLTQGQPISLLQDIPVETLLRVVQLPPLLPGEVQSYVLKGYWHLKQHKNAFSAGHDKAWWRGPDSAKMRFPTPNLLPRSEGEAGAAQDFLGGGRGDKNKAVVYNRRQEQKRGFFFRRHSQSSISSTFPLQHPPSGPVLSSEGRFSQRCCPSSPGQARSPGTRQ